ncbi:hypothetical protein [Streptomyces sp.]|uniref:hypothetical protein n=1 Tax=Streptomyces sp. TaxID=1931 RepID=UPI002D79ECD9|nr:hypothetical protein [Streptomyces sp.]HET6352890.1 hypothetical protein [Streptomyces sp.]
MAERRGNLSAVYAATAPLRRAEFYTGALTASAYRAFLDEELRDLSRMAATGFDPEIFRLIMTANLHLLDLAVATRDTALAESQLAALENDPWLREFGLTDARSTEDMIIKVRARTALVRRAWPLAIRSTTKTFSPPTWPASSAAAKKSPETSTTTPERLSAPTARPMPDRHSTWHGISPTKPAPGSGNPRFANSANS